MGSSVCVAVAEIVMQNIEEQALATDSETLPLWLRYAFTVYFAGEYLELTEDQTSERHQELLAEFERRKKVNIWKGNYVLELKVCDL